MIFKKFLQNTFILLAAILAFLFIGELSLRTVFSGWSRDWTMTQNIKEEFQKKFSTDNNALRFDTDQYLIKGENTFRVMVLGDSYARGDCILENDKLFTSVLERRLNQYFKDTKIEVMNFGVPGFTTINEFELLRKTFDMFKPDLVVIQFLTNDTQISNENYAHLETIDEFDIKTAIVQNKKIHDFLLNRSLFYAFLNHKYLWLQIKHKIPLNYGFKEDYPGWKQCKHALKLFAAFCTEKNITRPVLVIFPNFLKGVWNLENFPEIQAHRKVKNYAEANSIEVLDLLPIFLGKKRDLQEFWVLPFDFHLSQEAHEIAGNEIANFLISNRIIYTGIIDNEAE